MIPFVDRTVKTQPQTVTMDITPKDVITKDNATVRVNAVTYFNVVDPVKAMVAIENRRGRTDHVAIGPSRAAPAADVALLRDQRSRLSVSVSCEHAGLTIVIMGLSALLVPVVWSF